MRVGYISEIHLPKECGCSFYWPGEENNDNAKSIFSSDWDNSAWMNLNEQDVRIELLKPTASMKNVKKGGRHYELYRYIEIQIRIDYPGTWTCESDMPESESCEVTYYDLTITFNQNGKQNSYDTKGWGGC